MKEITIVKVLLAIGAIAALCALGFGIQSAYAGDRSGRAAGFDSLGSGSGDEPRSLQLNGRPYPRPIYGGNGWYYYADGSTARTGYTAASHYNNSGDLVTSDCSNGGYC